MVEEASLTIIEQTDVHIYAAALLLNYEKVRRSRQVARRRCVQPAENVLTDRKMRWMPPVICAILQAMQRSIQIRATILLQCDSESVNETGVARGSMQRRRARPEKQQTDPRTDQITCSLP